MTDLEKLKKVQEAINKKVKELETTTPPETIEKGEAYQKLLNELKKDLNKDTKKQNLETVVKSLIVKPKDTISGTDLKEEEINAVISKLDLNI